MTNNSTSSSTPSTAETAPVSRGRRWLGYLLKYGVPLVVTVLLCKLLFDGVDFNEMVDIIRRECDYRWILLMMAISILSHVFRAMRWGIQLRALDVKVPLFPLVLSIFGTYAVNLVLPRLGELWRTGYIARRQDAPFATVFGSMVADRLADTVTVALLTVVTFFLATGQMHTYLGGNAEALDKYLALLRSPWLWAALVGCIVLAWLVFFRWRTSNRVIVKIQGFVRGLWHGFAVIASMPGKGRWLLLTVAVWGCYFLQMYVTFFAFPFTEAIVSQYGALAVLVVFVLSSLSMGVPSNGGIGPWQWSVILGLGLYGLAKEPATAFANLVMGSQTLLLILLGIFTFVCIAIRKRQNNS